MKRKIDDVISNKEFRENRIDIRLSAELKRQKESGKEFISDKEIDDIIDKAIKDAIINKDLWLPISENQISNIIEELDHYASDVDQDYGLPTYGHHLSHMENIIKEVIKS